jgi:hypothetical protein
MSKLLKDPINLMHSIVKADRKGKDYPEFKKYQLISAHDEQISNLWQFLEPVDFMQDDLNGKFTEWYYIPFASHLHMELHRKKDCEHHCFYILFSSNG